uniref:LOW QUALITY PROTEIN: uncharacterized protein LOC106993855 n=1 Tax=Macaca mulatta TaxID=9544 RepID=UPI0010A24235|nr:LOW QUALITY PROTEIN: uncharacterized protein LOC106993855 [Macaca mulatta]
MVREEQQLEEAHFGKLPTEPASILQTSSACTGASSLTRHGGPHQPIPMPGTPFTRGFPTGSSASRQLHLTAGLAPGCGLYGTRRAQAEQGGEHELPGDNFLRKFLGDRGSSALRQIRKHNPFLQGDAILSLKLRAHHPRRQSLQTKATATTIMQPHAVAPGGCGIFIPKRKHLKFRRQPPP